MWIKRRSKPRAGRLKGDDLTNLRNECFERDKKLCQHCGITVNPDLHHTHPLSAHMAHIRVKQLGGDVLSNVRTLCGTDHRIEHQYGKSMKPPCPPKDGL